MLYTLGAQSTLTEKEKHSTRNKPIRILQRCQSKPPGPVPDTAAPSTSPDTDIILGLQQGYTSPTCDPTSSLPLSQTLTTPAWKQCLSYPALPSQAHGLTTLKHKFT